jgi:hypothetical protein
MNKGTYVDEALIKLQNYYQSKTNSYDLIADELPIRGKRVRFVPTSLFDGNLNILIPDNFIEMPENIAKARYLSNYRPPVLLTSPSYDENLGFHLLSRKEFPEYNILHELIKKMKDSVRQHALETVFYGKDSFYPDKAQGMWFEYKNFTLDDETYNLQLLVLTDKYLLAGTFNCRMCFYDEWKDPILKSLDHIKIGRKED